MVSYQVRVSLQGSAGRDFFGIARRGTTQVFLRIILEYSPTYTPYIPLGPLRAPYVEERLHRLE